MFVLSGALGKSSHPAHHVFKYGPLGSLGSGVVSLPEFGGTFSSLSTVNMIHDKASWWLLFRQPIPCALVLAFASAGSNMLAKIAIMAMTTSNSISVKPLFLFVVFMIEWVLELEVWLTNTNPFEFGQQLRFAGKTGHRSTRTPGKCTSNIGIPGKCSDDLRGGRSI